MRTTRCGQLACTAGALAAASVYADGPAAPGLVASGRVIARARPGPAGRPADVAGLFTAGVIRVYPEVSEWVLRTPAGETDEAYARRLTATGRFEYAHPDRLVSPARIPNDPRYSAQWHLPRMNMPAAWDVTIGDASVVVAFCDSGVDLAHPDLAGVLVFGYNSVDNLAQADGGNVGATNDHGTEVAGCIGAVGDNAAGVAGMGWNLRLMPIRVTNQTNGNAFLSEINEGARWAADHGAKVVNISYSGVSAATNATTGQYLRDRGVSCVWAAGNAGAVAGPLDIPELFVVGATAQTDALASFSNFGPAVDVVAPGVAILTTKVGGYAAPDGTSFAAPLAAGLLALTRSVNPSWGPAESEAAVVRTVHDLGAAGRDDTFGAGLIDGGAAVALARDARTVAMPPIVGEDRFTLASGTSLDLDVLANDVDLNTGGPLTLDSADATFPGGWASIARGAGPGGRDVLRVSADAAFHGATELGYLARNVAGATAPGRVRLDAAIAPVWTAPAVVVAPFAFGDVRRIRAADLDGDGDLDLAVGQISTFRSVTLLRNDGGVFVFAAALDLPTNGDFFDVADFNRDGRPDIVSGSFVPAQMSVALATGPFVFAAPSTISAPGFGDLTASTEAGAPLDVNGDGNPDLASTNTTSSTVEVRLGNGAGAFGTPRSYAVGISPVMIKAANVAGDARADLIVGSTGGQSVGVLVANANGVFSAVRTNPLGVDPADLAALDADGDGAPDLAVLCSGLLGQPPGVSVLGPTGGGSFTLRARLGGPGDTPWRFAAADFNRDGSADLLVVNKGSVNSTFYPGTGVGGLGRAIGPRASSLLLLSSVRAADLDGDGVPDAVLGGQALSQGSLMGAVEILLNRTSASCSADFTGDGFVDFFDYAAFVECFEGGACTPYRRADVNFDGFADFFDYLDFITAFERGC